MNTKPQLIATIADATVTASSRVYPHFVGIEDYVGKPLYCYTTEAAPVLTVLVTNEDVPGRTNDPTTAQVDRLDITVRLSKPGKTSEVGWSQQLAPGYELPANSRLSIGMRLESDLRTAHLQITDRRRQVADTDARLYFILVREDPKSQYRIEWVSNEIYVENAQQRIDASVVPPLPNDPGILGPMGLATP